jgi:branched-chain amino acid transport system ATP-binding protein
MLTIDDLVSGYGRVPVLHNVSLEVRQGELVTIIGSNGAGKSTLLRTVSGLLRAVGGSIRFEGREIANLRPDRIVRAGLVQCPEGRHVFAGLTVLDNLRMGAHCNRVGEAAGIDRAFSLFPQLKERAGNFAGSLSGGEQQMLAIARALMSDPRLVLLDEPSLGLAPLVVEQVLGVARRIRDEGRTVLLVEQNAELALEVADRAYVLERGRVVDSGEARQLARSKVIRDAYLGGSAVVAEPSPPPPPPSSSSPPTSEGSCA